MRATRRSMQNAGRLRRALSTPEAMLWNLLRRSPAGVRFRRQYPVGPYIADFYCPAAKLVIEVDGDAHNFAESAARDEVRDRFIRSLGLEVLRIPAGEVFRDATAIADALVRMCVERIGPSTTQLR